MTTQDTYITPEVKRVIGAESPERVATDPVTTTEIRRFTQAIMDPDPIYWNEEYARKTRYKGVVCPPLFPTTYFRTPPGDPDPIQAGFQRDTEFDGLFRERTGLPEVPIPLKRTLNAGNEIEFFQYAKPGEKVISRSKIVDIYEREGRTGRMVFIVTEVTCRNDKGELLLIARQSGIRR